MKLSINKEPIPIPDQPKIIELPIPSDIKATAKETTTEWLLGMLEALGEFIVDTIGAISLIGGGLCILFKIAGWEDGYKWAGILFLANVLIKYLFGG